MKKFFSEFKTFITRGNVVDMAVGVIVGSSFTAIVNGMSNFILKPIINWLLALIFGANSLSEVFTMLQPAFDEEGKLDLENSIYINWGEFINTVINFILIALVLFTIVKLINRFRDIQKDIDQHIQKKTFDRSERKELRQNGIKPSDKEKAWAYFEAKKKAAAEKAEAEKLAAEEAAKAEREANPTTEDLLKQILVELKNR